MPAPGRSLLPRKLIVGESIVSVSGFSFILVQNRWSYLLPVVAVPWQVVLGADLVCSMRLHSESGDEDGEREMETEAARARAGAGSRSKDRDRGRDEMSSLRSSFEDQDDRLKYE